VLRIDGTCGGEIGEFLIAIGQAAQAKHALCVGMTVSDLMCHLICQRTDSAGTGDWTPGPTKPNA